MWSCTICSHKPRKRANVIRHLKLVHDIIDRDGKNATKDSNKAVGMISDIEDWMEPSVNGFNRQSGMVDPGRPTTEGQKKSRIDNDQGRRNIPKKRHLVANQDLFINLRKNLQKINLKDSVQN